MNPAPITVICGLIRNAQKQYFIARRAAHKSHAGYWEFPGGKLEPNETHEGCLKRELMEELGMSVKVLSKAAETLHEFATFHIHLIAYHCELKHASYHLRDHDSYLWLPLESIGSFQLTASDRTLLEQLLKTRKDAI